MSSLQGDLYSKLHEPLWAKIRPKNWDDFYDYAQFSEIRLRFKSKPFSLLLYGPPGSGKTTFAELLIKDAGMNYIELPAPSVSVEDIKEAVKKAPIIIFMDEFHRFSKSRQDYLLKPIEEGKIVLIAALTESPWVYLTRPLLSRLFIKEIHPPDQETFSKILTTNWEKAGFKKISEKLQKEIEEYTWPDFRRAYQSIEFIYQKSIKHTEDELYKILKEYFADNKGLNRNLTEDIYDLLSAMIKSMRGSDPDSALLYMTSLLNADADPALIARRLVVFASEDIGLANSQALVVATQALTAVEKIGMPEAKIILSHVLVYLSLMPKSNSTYMAMKKAEEYIHNKKINPPGYILNHDIESKNYEYPHKKGGLPNQNYWPKDQKREIFYQPYQGIFENSLEKKLAESIRNALKNKS